MFLFSFNAPIRRIKACNLAPIPDWKPAWQLRGHFYPRLWQLETRLAQRLISCKFAELQVGFILLSSKVSGNSSRGDMFFSRVVYGIFSDPTECGMFLRVWKLRLTSSSRVRPPTQSTLFVCSHGYLWLVEMGAWDPCPLKHCVSMTCKTRSFTSKCVCAINDVHHVVSSFISHHCIIIIYHDWIELIWTYKYV